ncbi:S8 family serine peptidase, partial [Stenotrophomonas sp. GbtcB23]|uniref:S8 family serine peptidase n=1 Tax=Stenotrophomonas sp. GbtcB23 TaxID=2824768 RepID=UPI001C2FAEBF
IAAAGGAYKERSSELVTAPKPPEGTDLYLKRYDSPTVPTKVTADFVPLDSDQIPASEYKILAPVVVTTAPSDASDAEKLASLKPALGVISGTSMSTPTVAAGAAVTASRFPYLQNWQVRDTLLTTAKDLGAPGIDRVYGWGLMDLSKAMSGPAKLFQLNPDYDVYKAEKAAVDKYNPIVRTADIQATKSYEAAKQARLQRMDAENFRKSGKNDLAAIADAKATAAQAEADAFAAEARKLELTRIQPNLPEDTEEAAFEYINFVV